MALKIGDNFSYQGKKPNFDRDSFDTLAAMKAFPETSIDEGHISYCKEDGKNYQYKSANSVDETTGKWREFSSGLGGGGYMIDYITEEEGTITEEQYNSIVNAITNNIPVYIDIFNTKFYNVAISFIETFITLSIIKDRNVLLIYIQNDYSYEIEEKLFIKDPILGTTGQVLTKTARGAEWKDIPEAESGLPSGGTAGQVLKKTASGTEWANDKDTTYDKATQQADGLMSKEDKTKLDNLTGASFQVLTQEEYDATNPKAEDTIYFIKG